MSATVEKQTRFDEKGLPCTPSSGDDDDEHDAEHLEPLASAAKTDYRVEESRRRRRDPYRHDHRDIEYDSYYNYDRRTRRSRHRSNDSHRRSRSRSRESYQSRRKQSRSAVHKNEKNRKKKLSADEGRFVTDNMFEVEFRDDADECYTDTVAPNFGVDTKLAGERYHPSEFNLHRRHGHSRSIEGFHSTASTAGEGQSGTIMEPGFVDTEKSDDTRPARERYHPSELNLHRRHRSCSIDGLHSSASIASYSTRPYAVMASYNTSGTIMEPDFALEDDSSGRERNHRQLATPHPELNDQYPICSSEREQLPAVKIEKEVLTEPGQQSHDHGVADSLDSAAAELENNNAEPPLPVVIKQEFEHTNKLVAPDEDEIGHEDNAIQYLYSAVDSNEENHSFRARNKENDAKHKEEEDRMDGAVTSVIGAAHDGDDHDDEIKFIAERVQNAAEHEDCIDVDLFWKLKENDVETKWCPVCKHPAPRTKKDIEFACSLMTCINCEPAYTYWCWDCLHIFKTNELKMGVGDDMAAWCKGCAAKRRQRVKCKNKSKQSSLY